MHNWVDTWCSDAEVICVVVTASIYRCAVDGLTVGHKYGPDLWEKTGCDISCWTRVVSVYDIH